MIGWAVFALIAGLAALSLWLMRVPRVMGSFVGAAMMLGATGYVLSGHPGQAGHAVRADHRGTPIEPELIALRETMFGRFTYAETYLKASDAMMSAGNAPYAVQVVLGGLYKDPQDAALWSWLGIVLQRNDGGQVSPAAQLAFYRAMTLAPRHPGPRFFYGLALIRTGDLKGARRAWLNALALTPRTVGARREIAVRLALLDVLIAQTERAPARP